MAVTYKQLNLVKMIIQADTHFGQPLALKVRYSFGFSILDLETGLATSDIFNNYPFLFLIYLNFMSVGAVF